MTYSLDIFTRTSQEELVELHHGKISVESKQSDSGHAVTGWTEFTVELPSGRKHLKDEEIVEGEIESAVILNEVKNLSEY